MCIKETQYFKKSSMSDPSLQTCLKYIPLVQNKLQVDGSSELLKMTPDMDQSNKNSAIKNKVCYVLRTFDHYSTFIKLIKEKQITLHG